MKLMFIGINEPDSVTSEKELAIRCDNWTQEAVSTLFWLDGEPVAEICFMIKYILPFSLVGMEK